MPAKTGLTAINYFAHDFLSNAGGGARKDSARLYNILCKPSIKRHTCRERILEQTSVTFNLNLFRRTLHGRAGRPQGRFQLPAGS